MGRKKLIRNSASRKELRAELNKIATVVWEDMPHEPCRYQRLSDTIRRILVGHLSLILEGRGLVESVLNDPGLDQELRVGLESWLRRTRPYKDDPETNDSNASHRSSGVSWDWEDEEDDV